MLNLKSTENEKKAGMGKGTAIQDLLDRHLVSEEQLLGKLFKGYFNNKMSVLVFFIQAKQHQPGPGAVNGMCCFLDDLYRHILEDSKQIRYRRVFVWLKGFVQKLPNVRDSQRDQAIDFVGVLYEAFGIHPKSQITGA